MVVLTLASLYGLVVALRSKSRTHSASSALHYRWTALFCFLSSMLASAAFFLRGPVVCSTDSEYETHYCIATSTFIHPVYQRLEGSAPVGDYLDYGDVPDRERIYQTFYLWVPFVLFFQGCLFRLPHLFLTSVAGRQFETLLEGINDFSTGEDSGVQKKRNIEKYLRRAWGQNKKYWLRHIFCELLNLVNVVGQIFLMDAFFGGGLFEYMKNKHMSLLPEIEDDADPSDPITKLFPRDVKCERTPYGPTGGQTLKGILCVLTQNPLFEVIFRFMWLWFQVLATLTFTQLLVYILMSVSAWCRCKVVELDDKLGGSPSLKSLVDALPLADFFLLFNVGRNMNVIGFQDIVEKLQAEDVEPLPELYPPLPSAPMAHIGVPLSRPGVTIETLDSNF